MMEIMIFIYGTRAARHPIGYVAERCPACAQTSVCRVFEISRGGHFFFIPLGRGSVPLAHEARCLTCKKRFEMSAVLYHGFGRKKKASLSELIPLTSPWLGAMDAQAHQEESRFRDILSSFVRCDQSLRGRSLRIGMQFDWLGGLAVLTMFVAPMALTALALTNGFPFLSRSQAVALAWAGSVAAVVWAIYMIVTEEARFFRRQLLPRIREELAPLDAQRSDWEKVVLRLKRLRLPSWRMVRRELRRGSFCQGPEGHTSSPMSDASPAGDVWQSPRAQITQPR
jgi:hypothetical protein